MKVDLPIEQMEVKEVEEEQNSYKDFKNHQNAAFSTRSSPSRTNKDTKGEEMSSKKCGIRSHMSKFLKEKKKVTLNCGPNGV
ncbi:hypothetical protein cypCar_00008731 [Cyprinus carpio]|nr:hypothetical protein cypCar_00008731 [Cyprinus carpio]